MKQEITLYDGKKISYSIRKSQRARRLRIAIFANCDIIVTLPYRKPASTVEMYLKKKAGWISRKLDYFSREKSIFVKSKTENYEENKQIAEKLALRIIKKYKKQHGFQHGKITIKNHQTKWGSCSKNSDLNFNYKIAFLPKHLAEYIVVHELCHLKEASHSRRYWNLVEKVLPNYRNFIHELRSY